MTVHEFLTAATTSLQEAGVETARLDCLVLLEDALGMDRAHLLAHPELILGGGQEAHLHTQIAQRSTHLPLAYIRGHVLFYGRDFMVNEHVLVPRPETETIIELLKSLSLPASARIADIGTGSGCIGITTALELPGSNVDLYDIDETALQVARQNIVRLHATNTHSYQSDLLARVNQPYDILVTNLPYVADYYPINQAAAFEPSLALFSGADGLDHYRTFWLQTGALAQKPKYILTESLPSQHHALALLARNAGYILEKTDDFIQLFSV
ncbi:MAG: N5-glutamine methyltransferase family protein [Candidatus Saccharibacteria bacterium]